MNRQKNKNKDLKGSVIEIDIAEIIIPEKLIRRTYSEDKLAELKNSISDIGLINPVSVKKTEEGFVLMAGYRRYKAHVELRKKTILASVYAEKSVMEEAIMLHENLIREDVSIADEAEWVALFVEENRLSKAEAARVLSRSEAWVRERIAIASWAWVLKNALREKQISLSAAREFAKCEDHNQIQQWVYYAGETGVSASVAREWVRDWELQQQVPLTDEQERNYERILTQETQPASTCVLCEEAKQPGELRFVKVCRGCLQIAKAAMKQLASEE
jgi:ParB/RepB/Spo0J family partition protein